MRWKGRPRHCGRRNFSRVIVFNMYCVTCINSKLYHELHVSLGLVFLPLTLRIQWLEQSRTLIRKQKKTYVRRSGGSWKSAVTDCKHEPRKTSCVRDSKSWRLWKSTVILFSFKYIPVNGRFSFAWTILKKKTALLLILCHSLYLWVWKLCKEGIPLP